MLRKVLHRVVRSLKCVVHFAAASFFIVLPLGYDSGGLDSNTVSFGGHYGSGSVATILRSCEGDVLKKARTDFNDYSGSAELGLALGHQTKLIAGVRSGKWEADHAVIPVRYGESVPFRANFTYVNPFLSLESEKIGVGVGFTTDPIPTSLKGVGYYDEDSHSDITLHLRVGKLDKAYFAFSYCENQPLISTNGLFDMGIGFRASKRWDLFTGIGGGFYDHGAFVQQVRFHADQRVAFDFGFRLGQSAGLSECAVSGGLQFNFTLPTGH